MRRAVLWMLAVFITLASAFYQRMAGPTYPVRVKIAVGPEVLSFKLPRSADSARDCRIEVRVPNRGVMGVIEYRRYETGDSWIRVPLERTEDFLAGHLPKQPPAGKLAYRVLLNKDGVETSLTEDIPVVIRFKGSVPLAVLLPHILIMFLAMLFSTRAGLEAVVRDGRPRRYAVWTFVLLVVGGMIFGPVMQKLAFGSFWTGIPFGHDLTDNKTLFSLAVWAAALITGRKGRPAKGWVLAASIITLIVYLIPHSLLGSELRY